MADPPPYSKSGDDSGAPRWVKVFGIVVMALVLLFAILHLAGLGLGDHTP
jgi:hypothetical protein